MTPKMLSIICPFYNEKDNLELLYHRLKAVVSKLTIPCELIFVDDGSTDGGKERLSNLIKEDDRSRLIQFEKNRGKSAALYAGIRASKGETLATLDADVQVPPEEILRLLPALDGVDIVAGIRVQRRDHWGRRVSSKVAGAIRRYVLKDHIHDIGCPLVIFRRKAGRCFLSYQNMHRFFLAFAEYHGFKIKQLPVKHEPRRFGRSKYGFWNRALCGLFDLITFWWILRRRVVHRKGVSHGDK